jgi:membrane-bound metal-dependent hydrolase YbcI (DUF457 family)
MATPIGHGLIGMTLARRMGVRSKSGLAAAAIAGSLPDVDIIIGKLVHNDPWKIHRQGTHTINFATAAGALAGLAGIVRAESIQGERDLLMDAMIGAAVVGSHVVLDKVPIPALPYGPAFIGTSLANWVVDAVIWSAAAYALWPREPRLA